MFTQLCTKEKLAVKPCLTFESLLLPLKCYEKNYNKLDDWNKASHQAILSCYLLAHVQESNTQYRASVSQTN